jgi:hypothetical protein
MRLLSFLPIFALIAAPAFADTTRAFLYAGSASGDPTNIEAQFQVVGVNLVVTLYNLTSNLTKDDQILTGVLFNFNNNSTAGTLSNPTNQKLYNINDSNGALTQTGSPVTANWKTELNDFGTYVTLTNLNNGNHAGSEGIISTTTNSSGTSNLAAHDSYFAGPMQFTIAGLGLTSASQIANVRFNFGTAMGDYSDIVTSQITATPEPSTWATAAGAFLLLSGLVFQRKRQQN